MGNFRFKNSAICLVCFLITSSINSQANPSFFNILDYGAKGDGITLNTRSIQAAIDACSGAGGGTVNFPAGNYRSGTLYLKSHVTLYLEAGAILAGSKELKDYPVTVSKIRSYTDNYTDKSLIYGEDLENIAIIGEGTLDGNGASFKSDGPYKTRPYMIRLIRCKKVHVSDVSLVNSPMWVQHYLACEDVSIHGITVKSRVNWNNDGIDIDGCDQVRITDSFIFSGDDGIVLKSTMEKPCNNVTITNCIISSSCNAFKLGTETNGGFQNIALSNCTIYDTHLAGITLQMVDGGTLERVSISNVTMDNVGTAIFIRLGNRARPYTENMMKPGMGKLSNVIISNVQATHVGNTGCAIAGLPDFPVENVALHNIHLTFRGGGTQELLKREIPENPTGYPEHEMFGMLPAFGFYCRHVRNIRFDEVELDYNGTESRPAMVCDDVSRLELQNVKAGMVGTAGVNITVFPEDGSYVFPDNKRIANRQLVKGNPFADCAVENTDDRDIRIHNKAEAAKKRVEIIRAIWGRDSLPQRSDVVLSADILSPLNPSSFVARVDKIEIPVNAPVAEGTEPIKDLAYLFVPVSRNNRLVILNPGHTCTVKSEPKGEEYRIEETITGLLQGGFDVLAVYMPHVTDTGCSLDHCRVMNTPLGEGDHPATYGLRFFLEPEIVGLNYLLKHYQYQNVNMIGLSGGGWTTNLLAAMDDRIKYSFSVAGSMPLYYRHAGSMGDVEQFLPQLYRDIAGYPDLYVLGAIGKGRKQVQILNRYDDCCFGQKQHDPERNYDADLNTYEQSVKERLNLLGARDHYDLVIDEEAPRHQISGYALKEVILKELNSTVH
jgi:polygalacturonase